MIKLSDRLQKLADEIHMGETMADIGTDHGFLPVYLRKCGKCPAVIMTDVSAASLEKGRSFAAAHGYGADGGGVDLRVGDGLSVIKPFEVDAVVIAGMGGKLIRDIMAADMELTRSIGKFILQPRIGQGHLRRWLLGNDFIVINEQVVREGAHIPEIITAVMPDRIGDAAAKWQVSAKTDGIYDLMDVDGDSVRWRVPFWMIYGKGPVKEFILRNRERELEKLKNVEKAKVRDAALEDRIREDILYLEGLHEKYTNLTEGEVE